MGPKHILATPCPNFPPSFQITSPTDLLRPIPPSAGLTLFFRDTQLKTGHYTLMWSMSKVMRRIAGKVNFSAAGAAVEALRLWSRHLKVHSEESGAALREYFERNFEG